MNFIKTAIDGVFIIEPKVFNDPRGYFFEAFKQEEFEKNIGNVNFVQDNESKSSYGVLRGLHYQKGEYSQAKLVRVIKGKVVDVAVDIRKSSPTFGCTLLMRATSCSTLLASTWAVVILHLPPCSFSFRASHLLTVRLAMQISSKASLFCTHL